ncbi:MAG: hypothetical protein WCO28_08590 [Bacteroidota bacterium]
MKVRIFFLLAIFIFQNRISAQNFFSKDSTNSISKFQFGIGGYLGTHMFTNDKQLKNLSGYDNGLFIKAIYNFNKKVSTSIDIRYFERTGVINFNDDWTPEVFQVKSNGFEIPLMISYKFLNKRRKEIISLSAGGSYQFLNYQTSYDLLNQNQIISTTQYHHVIDTKTLNNFSAIFAIKKEFHLTKKSSFSVFNEYDFSINKFYIEDLTNNLTSLIWRKNCSFNSFCVRLGCCVIL